MFRRISISLAIAVSAALLLMAADVNIRLTAKGAARAQARSKDRIIWTGNNWSVTFTDRSPCQNGKKTFSSSDTGQNRICTISVTCATRGDKTCIYKYNSTADGAPPVDPEIEVVP